MFRATLLFLLSSAAAFAVLYYSAGAASPILDQPIGVVLAVGALIAALSVGFHTFIDGVAKDLPDKEKVRDVSALNVAVEKLGELRREVIDNVILVFVMVVIYALLSSTQEVVVSHLEFELVRWMLISLRFGCFMIIVSAAVVQLRGYRIATDLRNVLAKNK